MAENYRPGVVLPSVQNLCCGGTEEKMVLPVGFEPTTLGFRDRSSAAELKAAHGETKRKLRDLASKDGTHVSARQCNEREARRKELALVRLITSWL